MARPKFHKYFSEEDVMDVLRIIDRNADFVKVSSKVDICRDEKDNFLLALAIDGSADFLITGDNDLLDIIEVGKTKIITISQYRKDK